MNLTNSNPKLNYILWFLLPVIGALLFYKPFQQPIFFDRSYLLYMSQTVAHGNDLYKDTTLGYTPLSILLVGWCMKFGSYLKLESLLVARVLGLVVYGLCCVSFYHFSKILWRKSITVIISMLIFSGFGYLVLISSVNAEPKTMVLLLTILGFCTIMKSHWLMSGVLFSLAAMCWHPSVISLFAIGIWLVFFVKKGYTVVPRVVLGSILGTIPVVLYLFITSQWIDFWKQAVMRKIYLEGKVVGESPFSWLINGIYPGFTSEAAYFVFGVLGLILLTIHFNNRFKTFHFPDTITFFFIYLTLWCGFNSLEFQSNVDLFPMIPVIVILAAHFLDFLAWQIKHPILKSCFISIVVIYSYFDVFIYEIPDDFKSQREVIEKLRDKYGDLLSIGSTEFYVLQNQVAPTKYVNFLQYEESINASQLNCDSINDILQLKEINYAIQIDRSKRTRSEYTNRLVGRYARPPLKRISACKESTFLQEAIVVDSFEMKVQSVLMGGEFYTTEYYSILKLNN